MEILYPGIGIDTHMSEYLNDDELRYITLYNPDERIDIDSGNVFLYRRDGVNAFIADRYGSYDRDNCPSQYGQFLSDDIVKPKGYSVYRGNTYSKECFWRDLEMNIFISMKLLPKYSPVLHDDEFLYLPYDVYAFCITDVYPYDKYENDDVELMYLSEYYLEKGFAIYDDSDSLYPYFADAIDVDDILLDENLYTDLEEGKVLRWNEYIFPLKELTRVFDTEKLGSSWSSEMMKEIRFPYIKGDEIFNVNENILPMEKMVFKVYVCDGLISLSHRPDYIPVILYEKYISSDDIDITRYRDIHIKGIEKDLFDIDILCQS